MLLSEIVGPIATAIDPVFSLIERHVCGLSNLIPAAIPIHLSVAQIEEDKRCGMKRTKCKDKTMAWILSLYDDRNCFPRWQNQ